MKTQTVRTYCEDKSGGLSDAATSQGRRKVDSKPREARKRQRRIPYRFQREVTGLCPVNILISDSSLQNCDNKSV